MRSRRWVALMMVTAAMAAACGSRDAAPSSRLVVLAASSLTEVMGDLASAFEATDPSIRVDLVFAGSTAIREQVLSGVPADVVALASGDVMADLLAVDAVVSPLVFATNVPALVVPAGNPGGVVDIADLADEQRLVGLCRSAVPCGALADALLAAASVEPSVDTREPDVRALLAKIVDGELDAGIVYATDALAAAGSVEVIALSGEVPRTELSIAVLSEASSPALAEQFVALVGSDIGRQVVAGRGFGLPS